MAKKKRYKPKMSRESLLYLLDWQKQGLELRYKQLGHSLLNVSITYDRGTEEDPTDMEIVGQYENAVRKIRDDAKAVLEELWKTELSIKALESGDKGKEENDGK